MLRRILRPAAVRQLTMASLPPLTIRDVREAEERIRQHVHRTPVMTCSRLDAQSGHKLFFKCEIFQKAGSFKVASLRLY